MVASQPMTREPNFENYEQQSRHVPLHKVAYAGGHDYGTRHDCVLIQASDGRVFVHDGSAREACCDIRKGSDNSIMASGRQDLAKLRQRCYESALELLQLQQKVHGTNGRCFLSSGGYCWEDLDFLLELEKI